jgi:hypothetical protein
MAVLLLIGALLALAAAPSSDPPAERPEGPSYGARPAHHADGPSSGRLISHAVEVDTLVTDGVEIFNFTDEPASFDVYASDMVGTSGDGLAPAARDAEVTGPGTWVTVEQETVEVAPRSSLVVPLTIEVPRGTVPGEHVAAFLVEPVRATSEENIESRARVALQVRLEVLGEIDLGVQLGPLRWRRPDGEVHLTQPVTNGGNVTFVADGKVVLTDRAGQRIAEVPLTPADRTLAPEAAVTFEAVWSDPPWFGRVTALAVVDVQAGERAPVAFEGEPVTFWIVPWTQILGAFVLLALLATILLASRERRREWRVRRREEREVLREYRARREAGGEARDPSDHQPVA